jgi:two-component system, cell cycle sensor histidine kinase and response regulator CckA
VNGTAARAYGLAIVSTIGALAVTRFLWPVFAATPFAPLFGAIAATSQWGSGRAGMVAILLAVGGATLVFPGGWQLRTLLVFVPIAVFSSRLIATRKQTLAALRASEAELRATVKAQRQAELELRASERKLRQAQKMEAVGQLVAGVAHNFNNLLTVTMGYTDILLERHGKQEPDHGDLQEIRKATERGAALTRQLLAFGHKHDATVSRIDLNRAVVNLREMLTRVIEEDIELTIDIASAPAVVTVDPYDIDQAILNLVLNARDALPAGGGIHIDVARETIAASNSSADGAAPGEYVRVRVRDNGVGMTPDVQAHLFEPFFTTKEVGQGTGLGLPFVHGIARQAGGFVAVETAPAQGTTVSVYLPSGAGLM